MERRVFGKEIRNKFMKGILLNEENDLLINVRRVADGKITGGLVIGNNAVQCAGLVLQMNQGELKADPIIGANLLRNMRGSLNRDRLKNQIKIALTRANIRIEDVKNELDILINGQTINNGRI
jgi:LEA14-like dessication related protein